MSSLTVNCPNCGRPLRLREKSQLGKKGKCPSCQHRFLLEENRGESKAEVAAPPDADRKERSKSARREPLPSSEFSDIGNNVFEAGEFSAVQQLQKRQKRGRRKNLIASIAGAVVAIVAILVYLIVAPPTSSEKLAKGPARSASPPVQQRPETETSTAAHQVADAELATPATDATDAMPGVRESIQLQYVPAGAGIVINLHPARLWKAGSRGEEVRRCLGPLAEWAEQQLQRLSGFEPAEIDEAMICVILGTRGAPPDVAAVFHLLDEHPMADLLQKFPGKPMAKGPGTITVGEEFGFYVPDGRTVAVAPRRLAEEIFDAIADTAVADPGIEAILAQTDRQRDFTIVFRPADLRVHEPALIATNARGLSNALLTWLGEETEAVAWSVQFDDPFSSELFLRNEHSVGEKQLSSAKLRQNFATRLQYLPDYVLAAVKTMSPRTEGRRKVIGRLPAMTKAVSLATTSTIEERLARFVTILPERAAPNLALAARLAVTESARAGVGPPVATPPVSPAQPERIADRLKKRIEVDFRRTPLEDVFMSIGGDLEVAFVIDGKALEGAGYTRNMPQEFRLGPVAATAVLHEILKKYDQMVIVVDEEQRQFKVTTRAAAEKNGWTIFPVSP